MRPTVVKSVCRCLRSTTVQAAKMRRWGDLKQRRRDNEQLKLLLCGQPRRGLYGTTCRSAEWFRPTVAAWLTPTVSVRELVDSPAQSRRGQAALTRSATSAGRERTTLLGAAGKNNF
jgi:hypothetical protein